MRGTSDVSVKVSSCLMRESYLFCTFLFKQKQEMQLDLFCSALPVSSHMSVEAQTAATNFPLLPVEI